MPAWLRAQSLPAGNHLPPAEVSSLLTTDSKGRVRARDKIDTPLDEFQVPDGARLNEILLSSIQGPYEWPKFTNVHHTVWPRKDYDTGIERIYRNDPSLMEHVQVQFHNFKHAVTNPPEKAPDDVIYQRALELRYKRLIFESGRRAIRYARWSQNIELMVSIEADETWIDNTRGYYGLRARNEHSKMVRLIDRMPDPIMGVLPSREELGALEGVVSITRHLGETAAAQALDLRRTVQDASRQGEGDMVA